MSQRWNLDFFKMRLFGKRVLFTDPEIGEFSTLIRSYDPSRQYTWIRSLILPDQTKETELMLDGDFRGPFKSQLASIHQILDSLPLIIHTMDKRLQLDYSEYRTIVNWKDEFYLDGVLSLDSSKREFEVIFKSSRPKGPEYLSCYWIDGAIQRVGPT